MEKMAPTSETSRYIDSKFFQKKPPETYKKTTETQRTHKAQVGIESLK